MDLSAAQKAFEDHIDALPRGQKEVPRQALTTFLGTLGLQTSEDAKIAKDLGDERTSRPPVTVLDTKLANMARTAAFAPKPPASR